MSVSFRTLAITLFCAAGIVLFPLWHGMFPSKAILAAEKRDSPAMDRRVQDLQARAERLMQDDRCAEALAAWEQLIAILERRFGKDDVQTLEAQENMARALRTCGEYEQAEELFTRILEERERIVSARRRTFGPKHPNTLYARNALILAYTQLGQYDEAAKLNESLLRDCLDVFGPDDLDTIMAQINMAKLHESAGDFSAARTGYLQAAESLARAISPDAILTLDIRRRASMMLTNMDRPADAWRELSTIAAMQTASLGNEHSDTLQTRENMAFIYDVNGDFDTARRIFEQSTALARLQKKSSPEHPDVLNATEKLADLYAEAGMSEESVPLYEAVLQKRESLLGHDHPDVVRLRESLAQMFELEGELELACEQYASVLASKEKALGPTHEDVVSARLALATLYAEGEEEGKALDLYGAVLASRREQSGNQHPDVARALQGIAEIHEQREEYGKARESFMELIAVLEKRPDSAENEVLLEARELLANICRETGDYAEAAKQLRFIKEAIQNEDTAQDRDAQDDSHSFRLLYVYEGLAESYVELGQYAEARGEYEQMLTLGGRLLNPDHDAMLRACIRLSDVYEQLGEKERSRVLYEHVLEQMVRSEE